MNYINAIRAMWTINGIDVDQYYPDPSSVIPRIHRLQANIGSNGGNSLFDYKKAK
jgi:hypothetical protein